jgi:hypothetical protein
MPSPALRNSWTPARSPSEAQVQMFRSSMLHVRSTRMGRGGQGNPPGTRPTRARAFPCSHIFASILCSVGKHVQWHKVHHFSMTLPRRQRQGQIA